MLASRLLHSLPEKRTMQSEQLSNLHPGWVVGGWALAAAVTSGVYLGGVGMGLVPPGTGAVVWVAISMGVGFFVGGFFVGLRWSEAPVLHAGAITLFSLIVWFMAAFFDPTSPFDSLSVALGVILLQWVAASAGGWAGRRSATGRTLG